MRENKTAKRLMEASKVTKMPNPALKYSDKMVSGIKDAIDRENKTPTFKKPSFGAAKYTIYGTGKKKK